MKARYRKKRQGIYFLFALPAIAVIALFMIYPVLMNIGYSFTNWNGVKSDAAFVGLENYRKVFASKELGGIIRNTLFFALTYLPILNILALALACLVKASGRLSGFFKAVCYFPGLLAPAVVGYIWRLLYDTNNGLINRVLRAAGLDAWAQNWLGQTHTVLPALSVTVIWACVGYYMILYYAGLMAVPTELYEAAAIDGATVMQRFFRITLPQIVPSLRMNLVFSTMGVLTMFDIPYTMTAGGPGYDSTTMALQIYYYNYNMQPNLGVTLTVVLLAFTIAIILLQNFALGRGEAS